METVVRSTDGTETRHAGPGRSALDRSGHEERWPLSDAGSGARQVPGTVSDIDVQRVPLPVDQDRPEGPSGDVDRHHRTPMGGSRRGAGGRGQGHGDDTEGDQGDHHPQSARESTSGSCIVGSAWHGLVLTFLRRSRCHYGGERETDHCAGRRCGPSPPPHGRLGRDAIELDEVTTPVEAMTADSDARRGWTTGGVRLFAAVLVGFQVVQGLSDPIPTGNRLFTESYYLVTYNHGFIRRGLLGEVIHLVVGVPSRGQVDVVADLVVVLAIGAVLGLIELLIRRATADSWAMALLLAASPFTIDFFLVDRRPDLLALVLLVALGLVVTRGARGRLAGLTGIGLGLAAMVLVHEDVILVVVPWAVVLVTMAFIDAEPNGAEVSLGTSDATGGERGRAHRPTLGVALSAVAGPSLVATLAVLAFGLPSSGRVAALESDVATLHLTGNTVFTYLPNSIRTSIRLVGSIPPTAKAWTLLLGAILIAIQLGWILAWVRPRLGTVILGHRHRGIGAGLAVVVVVPTVILFATGFDWVRWFADCGAAWLIVQGFAPLLPGSPEPAGGPDEAGHHIRDSRGAPVEHIRLSKWLPALAVYLAAVPPLDVLYITGQIRHFLFFV